MKRTSLLWLAIASVALAGTLHAATRPHYGGTLRIEIAASLSSLDPVDVSNRSVSAAIRDIAPLLFDTLITIDSRGEVQPSLATAWKSDFNARRWELQLRPGITFSDGTPLTANEVSAALRAANPQWRISAEGESVIIESDVSNAELPAELALARNSILLRPGGRLIGTGPFTVSQWDARKNLKVTARDDYWDGRPFVDTVEISMGRVPRDQALSLDLGRADVIEVAPGQPRRAASVKNSAPDELLALVFNRAAQSQEDGLLRQALSSGIDRDLLNNVVLQGAGEPAGGLLPNWMTGYEFAFLTPSGHTQSHADIKQSLPWKLSYDPNDIMARVIAERIALNAQDAGVRVQLVTSGVSDLRLLQLPLSSRNPRVALSELAAALQFPAPSFHGGSAEDLYAAENTMLKSQRVIPLLHVRNAVGLASNVHGWDEGQDGSWNVPNVWLNAEKP
jgi:ABC-type transport system substrate-binding protein